MINVKIIKKPKNSGTAATSGGLASYSDGGYSAEAAHAALADEATHAVQADEATHAAQSDEAAHAASSHALDEDSPTRKDFLSAVHDDEAAGKIRFKQGAEFGAFQPGLTGAGANIGEDGFAEMRGLRLWEWLEVPELRYNRVSVYTGIRWDTFGGGIIEAVTQLTATTGRIRLKLEEGEAGAIVAGDLCMGIWHFNDTTQNAEEDADDRRGTFAFRGFATAYFRIDTVSGGANAEATYTLRAGTAIHPQAGMHFAARGNVSDTSRQSFTYTTTQYSLMLSGVNTWEWSESNYVAVQGLLDGFSMNTPSGIKRFSGYGLVFGNAYMYGHIDQFERAPLRLEFTASNGLTLKSGMTTSVAFTLFKGFDTQAVQSWKVAKEGDMAWGISHPVTDGALSIAFEDLNPTSVTAFQVTATTASGETATALVPIVRLADGEQGEEGKSPEELVIAPVTSAALKNGTGEAILEAQIWRAGENVTAEWLERSPSFVFLWTKANDSRLDYTPVDAHAQRVSIAASAIPASGTLAVKCTASNYTDHTTVIGLGEWNNAGTWSGTDIFRTATPAVDPVARTLTARFDVTNTNDGADGADAQWYEIRPDVAIIQRTAAGQCIPTKVGVQLMSHTGSTEEAVSNAFLWYRTTVGGDYTSMLVDASLNRAAFAPSGNFPFYELCATIGSAWLQPTLPDADAKRLGVAFLRIPLVADGEKGDTGLHGATMRPRGYWQNGANYESSDDYIDVVLGRVNNEAVWYACKQTHTSSDSSRPPHDGSIGRDWPQYWTQSDKLSFVATDLLLAQTAYIDNLGVRLLQTSPYTGVPRTVIEGNTFNIFGREASPNIQLYVDADGIAHLQFLRDGVVLYDLGPDGLKNVVTRVPDTYDSYTLLDATSETAEHIANLSGSGTPNAYRYHAGYNILPDGSKFYDDGGSTPPSTDGKFFNTATASTTNYKADGIYADASIPLLETSQSNVYMRPLRNIESGDGTLLKWTCLLNNSGAWSFCDKDGNETMTIQIYP